MMAAMSTLMSLITSLTIMSFILQRKHILMCLLSLEAAVLSLAFSSAIMFSPTTLMDLFAPIIILTFGACEAAVALSVLVITSRSFGTDMVASSNTNKC